MAEVQATPQGVKQPKPFDAEQEIAKLWAKCQGAQDEIRRAFYSSRAAAIAAAGDDADANAIALNAWQFRGHDIAKSYFPRINLTKGSLAEQVGQLLVGSWRSQGAVVKLVKSENPDEVFVEWTRCPWPTAAKNYGAPMAEDVAGCDLMLQTAVADVALFIGRKINIETTKAIPRGEGKCVRRIWLEK